MKIAYEDRWVAANYRIGRNVIHHAAPRGNFNVGAYVRMLQYARHGSDKRAFSHENTSPNSTSGGDNTMVPYNSIVPYLDKIVDLHSIPDDCIPPAATVNASVGTNLDINSYQNAFRLWFLLMSAITATDPFVQNKSETILTYSGPWVQNRI